MLDKILEAMRPLVDEIATMKEQLSDVMDAVASQDKRIEKLERLIDNA